MPRNSVDWTALDSRLGDLPPPEEQFAQEVENEVKRMEGVLTEADRSLSKTGRLVVALASNRGDADSYIAEYAAHRALLQLFEHHGVLDGYYGTDPTTGRETGTGYDWTIELLPPEGIGRIKVVHRTIKRQLDAGQKGKTFARQEVTYFPTRRY